MLRTASIRLNVDGSQAAALTALQSAYADACNRLVPMVMEHRCWNRVALHPLTYARLRKETPLGSQMACNAIFSVCKAYKAQKELGRIKKDAPVPAIRFDRASVHFDKRTYSIKGECLSLYTLSGRLAVTMVLGEHQRRIIESGSAKKAKAAGIAVEYVNPAFTSQTCSCCGALGRRIKHRFVCDQCGLRRAHSDGNASRNLARSGKHA
jgi:hypothetical protein